jgi:hypothetical protein
MFAGLQNFLLRPVSFFLNNFLQQNLAVIPLKSIDASFLEYSKNLSKAYFYERLLFLFIIFFQIFCINRVAFFYTHFFFKECRSLALCFH